MLYLFTGQPGSQKTANMLNFVLNDEQFKNRPVFYFNIRDCQVEGWQELTEEDVNRWYELPQGSVILIDEAQTIFRPQKWDKEKQRTVTELETHRHHGFDIVMTTQHPMLINTDVRRQVQQHRHYKKPYGLKSVCHVWEKCVTDPDDYHTKKEAETKSGKVPPEVFRLYTSTVLNTHKKRVPKKLLVFAALLLATIGSVGYLISVIAGKAETAESFTSAPQDKPASAIEAGLQRLQGSGSSSPSDGSYQPVYPLDPESYIKLWTPRIPGKPDSAPVYDELAKPTTVPKTRCYGWSSGGVYHCKCVTQQMTPVDMAYEQCVHTVNHGMWDPAPITQATYNSQGQVM